MNETNDRGLLPIKPLNEKAMLVKLTCKLPPTSRRDKEAEGVVQSAMNDTSLTVLSQLFRDKNNPVRMVLNAAGQIYAYHVKHTIPWVDRGPRMLPVDQYDTYRKEMVGMIQDVEGGVAKLMPHYDDLVAADIVARGTRAKIEDYPTKDEFKQRLSFKFSFTPLPDQAHFLFDVSAEDKAALTEALAEAEEMGAQHVRDMLKAPVEHLVKKLKIEIGQEGAIFRDSAVSNISEACDIAAGLAMGNEAILAQIAETRAALRSFAESPEVLRESPIVRQQAAAKLDEVAKKLSFMF